MKNIMKGFLILAMIVGFNACEESDNVIDQVVDDTTRGAILRTIEIQNDVLNSSVPSSEFSVTVEEQDTQGGDLLESVDVYVSLRDLTPDNGTTTGAAGLVKTIPASEFSPGPQGLPRATIKATFAEAESAMGITSADHAPGDLFVFELRLNLTDGRTFGGNSAGGIITGGFFSSPYLYNTLIACSPQPGTYRVEMHDSFGDGWQTDGGNGGSGITVNIDGTIVEVGMCSPYEASDYPCTPWPGTISDPTSEFTDATAFVEIPVGTESATWNFPGDQYGEISFEVYGPDDQLLLAVGVGEGTPGLLPVTLCLQ